MKVRVSEATGAVLDWAVAKCKGVTVLPKMRGGCYVTLVRGETVLLNYSTDWAQGGPIIERERIDFLWFRSDVEAYICAADSAGHFTPIASGEGPTPLIAAMRCYVASKLGDEVDVPEELK